MFSVSSCLSSDRKYEANVYRVKRKSHDLITGLITSLLCLRCSHVRLKFPQSFLFV